MLVGVNLVQADHEITGTIPTEFATMTNLLVLAIRDLLVTGTIPLELWTLPFTYLLDFSKNYELEGSIPTAIGLSSTIELLFIEKSPTWSGTIPSELGLLDGLTWLMIQNSNLIGSVPMELVGLTSLKHFRIDGNPLTGTFPQDFKNNALVEMRMNETMLTGEVPDVLCLVPKLFFDCPDMCGCDCPCSDAI